MTIGYLKNISQYVYNEIKSRMRFYDQFTQYKFQLEGIFASKMCPDSGADPIKCFVIVLSNGKLYFWKDGTINIKFSIENKTTENDVFLNTLTKICKEGQAKFNSTYKKAAWNIITCEQIHTISNYHCSFDEAPLFDMFGAVNIHHKEYAPDLNIKVIK